MDILHNIQDAKNLVQFKETLVQWFQRIICYIWGTKQIKNQNGLNYNRRFYYKFI